MYLHQFTEAKKSAIGMWQNNLPIFIFDCTVKTDSIMTYRQLEKFNTFLLQFTKFTYTRVVTPIYRGEDLERLCNKLGISSISSNDPNYTELQYRLFLIGEKSKKYFSEKYFDFNRSWTFDINEINDKVCNFIFDSINDSIKRNKIVNVQSFFSRNELFKQYFLDKANNKKAFCKNLLSLPAEMRLKARNYYLRLLHQIGSINYRDRSNMLSTSRMHSIAKQFANGTESRKGIIIHAWEPVFSRYNLNLKRHGLPTYTGKPYPRQNEISLMAGILPHYIIGLEILSEKKMFLNPNMFSNPSDKNVFINGFEINQDAFVEIIQNTNYSSYFTSNGVNHTDTIF
jgi:hypothetical protein